jgi:hypothetical protein
MAAVVGDHHFQPGPEPAARRRDVLGRHGVLGRPDDRRQRPRLHVEIIIFITSWTCFVLHTSGLPDFSWYMIPKPKKMYQMNTKCTKWSKNIQNVSQIFQIVINHFPI